MSPHDHASNQRRAERKRATVNAIVTDVISGLPIGIWATFPAPACC